MKIKQEFVEEVGLFYESFGVSRMLGRIIGWLMIADSPKQTMKQLTDALQVSKSSISTSTTSLIQMGMIKKTRIPGERSDRYQINYEMLKGSIDRKIQGLNAYKLIYEKALQILNKNEIKRKQLFEESIAWINFLNREFPLLRERFEKEHLLKNISN